MNSVSFSSRIAFDDGVAVAKFLIAIAVALTSGSVCKRSRGISVKSSNETVSGYFFRAIQKFLQEIQSKEIQKTKTK